MRDKLRPGTHIISEGKRRRELVKITRYKGKYQSQTFHQTRIKGEWQDNAELPEQYWRRRSHIGS